MGIFNEIGLRYSSRSRIKRLFSVGKQLMLLYRSVLIRHVEIKGVFYGETGQRTMVYIGEGESLSYFRELCFSTVLSQKESKSWIHQLAEMKKSLPEKVIVVAEVNRLLSMILDGRGYLGYPWVLQKVFITSKEYLDRKAYILRKRSKRVRKRQYWYDTTSDQSDIITFYHRFYKPYILMRFNTMAHLRHIRNFLPARNHGMLLRVFDRDQWVAGMICLQGEREVVSLGSAVLMENTDHLKQGAMLAAYYYLFQWAEENQMESVNLLRSRPHGNNGVFYHKTLWGAVALRDPWPHTCYTIRIPTRQPIPGVLEKQLVWDGSTFISLKTAAGKTDRVSEG